MQKTFQHSFVFTLIFEDELFNLQKLSERVNRNVLKKAYTKQNIYYTYHIQNYHYQPADCNNGRNALLIEDIGAVTRGASRPLTPS